MKILYVPMIRSSASYTVIFGRRWTVLEHLLLSSLSFNRHTAAELAELTSLPRRLVIEALINLLRSSWVEVRSAETGTTFSATGLGRSHANQTRLPAEEFRTVKSTALCHDRVTGSWLRAEDLEIVHERDLPQDAVTLPSVFDTFDSNDPSVRNLLRIEIDERLEPGTINFRTSSRPYARVEVAFGSIERGLPASASLSLRMAILDAASALPDNDEEEPRSTRLLVESHILEDVSDWNFVVGGEAHLLMLRDILEQSRDHVIIHSCFVSPETVEGLLPHFESAARRGVKIDLLWGLWSDPEDIQKLKLKPISETDKVLDRLPKGLRSKVQLSPQSSGSHAKVILYRDKASGSWITVIGSCNFLSSDFDWVEASFRSKSSGIAKQSMSFLLSAQLPSSGRWSPVARRLNDSWTQILTDRSTMAGSHKLQLLLDADHYACVTGARDVKPDRIDIGCDIYGLSAETTVLVPMEAAAAVGCEIALAFNRASIRLKQEGLEPGIQEIARRGMTINQMNTLHAKYMIWGDEGAAISSFNWLSTVVEGGRNRGAELGILIEGPRIRETFEKGLSREGVPGFANR